MGRSRALVIGAGIGGLTAAVALSARGWHVTVVERVPQLEPVGAGIAVAPNALRALDVVGLGDSVRELRSWTTEGGLRAPSGRWLARTTGDKAAERFGGPLVLLTRSALVDLLRSRLPGGVAVRGGTAAVLVDPGVPGDRLRPARVRLESAGSGEGGDGGNGREGGEGGDGEGSAGSAGASGSAGAAESFEAELVVAADGIHSATRRTLFPAHPGPRYAGFTTWRFLAEAPADPIRPHETWGRGRIWGTQSLPDGRIYAYAAATAPPGQRAADGERAELMRLFGGWHRPVPQLIRDVQPGAVLRNDVHHMTEPLPAHHSGRVVLIGDAAHAMAPSAGQGGNQSIEDAIVLGQLAGPELDSGTGTGTGTGSGTGSRASSGTGTRTSSRTGCGGELAEALGAYTRARLPRTSEVVRRSARAARLTTLTGGAVCALRNVAIGAVTRIAPSASLRALDGIADWSPPPRTYASQSRSPAHSSERSGAPAPPVEPQ